MITSRIDYSNVSPLFMMRLASKVESALRQEFGQRGDRVIKRYMEKWHEESEYPYWKNFEFEEWNGKFDLGGTLAGMPNDVLLRMAVDMGVPVPGLLPSVPLLQNRLVNDSSYARRNFESAINAVYDEPGQAVLLASSALESIVKDIIASGAVDIDLAQADHWSVEKLTKEVVGQIAGLSDPDAPAEVKRLAGALRAIGEAVGDLRSDKSPAHGKASSARVVDSPAYAMLAVNAVATVGLFLLDAFEASSADSVGSSDWDVLF